MSNNNPKFLEKKAENLMKHLMKKQKSQSRKILCSTKQNQQTKDTIIKIKGNKEQPYKNTSINRLTQGKFS